MPFKLIFMRPGATGHFQEQFELMYSQQSCLHLHIQDDNSDVEVHSIGTQGQKLQHQLNQLNNIGN